jgi:hypothetical protein
LAFLVGRRLVSHVVDLLASHIGCLGDALTARLGVARWLLAVIIVAGCKRFLDQATDGVGSRQ